MELRHLRYFVAIAEERSFTRAAERLWVAQPGLSTQIRRLETELGIQLFDRHTRGVDLTPAGELFLERARAALSAAEAAGATGGDLETGRVGALRLGIATGPYWQPTSALLRRFVQERSGVELTVLEGYGGTLWRDLRDARLDALLAPSLFSSADLTSLALGAEPWVALIGAGHPLAGDGPLPVTELSGVPIAAAAHRDGAALDRAIARMLADFGVAATFVAGVPGPALCDAVAAGDAVVLTTGPCALPSGVFARLLDPARSLEFELLWRDEAASAALNEFIMVARDAVDRRPTARVALAAVA